MASRWLANADYHHLDDSRTNIGNAKLFGLEKSLGLKGNQYNTALCKLHVV